MAELILSFIAHTVRIRNEIDLKKNEIYVWKYRNVFLQFFFFYIILESVISMKQKHFFQEIKWLNVQWIFYLFWTSGNKRKKNQACIKPSFKQFYFSQTYNMLILFIFKIKNKIKRQGRVSNPSNLKFVNKVTWRFCSVVRLFY